MVHSSQKYKVFTLRNFTQIPHIQRNLFQAEKHAIEVIGNVLPFKVNNYVVEQLIDWSNIPDDPIFQLTFPQKEMLSEQHFHLMEKTLRETQNKGEIKQAANHIRYQLNPHPGAQQKNLPVLDGIKLTGVQHKYDETVLFFPSNSQTCHAYCTFCFRWPQFVGIDELKFGMRETELLIKYLEGNPSVSDLLFTGGDPMVMSAANLAKYIRPILDSNSHSVQTIRIGTKALGYWPYRFTSDADADDLLRLFEEIVNRGYHLAIMAHFNHPKEMQTDAVRLAIQRIRNTGAEIRTQSPIMKHINDDPIVWKQMWKEQVRLGCIPYYMFVARDTGPQGYFAVPLERSWRIFRDAYRNLSGLARTVRGPSMSADPGKVHILGISEIHGQKVFVLQFLQARNPDWVGKPFFAKYNPDALWLDDLVPAFGGGRFFFENLLPTDISLLN